MLLPPSRGHFQRQIPLTWAHLLDMHHNAGIRTQFRLEDEGICTSKISQESESFIIYFFTNKKLRELLYQLNNYLVQKYYQLT